MDSLVCHNVSAAMQNIDQHSRGSSVMFFDLARSDDYEKVTDLTTASSSPSLSEEEDRRKEGPLMNLGGSRGVTDLTTASSSPSLSDEEDRRKEGPLMNLGGSDECLTETLSERFLTELLKPGFLDHLVEFHQLKGMHVIYVFYFTRCYVLIIFAVRFIAIEGSPVPEYLEYLDDLRQMDPVRFNRLSEAPLAQGALTYIITVTPTYF